MPWTFELTNGATTLNLNDGVTYEVRPFGFEAPAPALRASFAGRGNPSRPGEKLIRGVMHENRVVRLRLDVLGATVDVLQTNVQNVEAQLRRAQEYAAFGMGSQVQLKYQMSGATNPVYFNVLAGSFDPVGRGSHGPLLPGATRLVGRTLDLICEPYAVGTQESIENFVRDANFEIAGGPLSDWLQSKTATGTTARVTAQSKYGPSSLKLVMTNSGSSGQVIERNQSLADVDAAEVWSFACWVFVEALASCKFVLDIEYTGGGSTDTVEVTATNTGFVLVKVENKTIPASTTAAVFKPHLESTASSATGVAYVGACIAVQATSIPTAWVSSRDVRNHFDDNGQLHTNYLDIEDIPGDLPALLQIRAQENEAHTLFWCGARHATRQRDASIFHEAEDLVNADWLVDNADAAASGGNETRVSRKPAFVDTKNAFNDGGSTLTITSVNPSGTRRMLLVWICQSEASPKTVDTVVFNTSESMTKVGDVTNGANRTTAWVLANPTATSASVVATLSGTANRLGGIAVYYSGVTDQTTKHEDIQTSSGIGTSTNVTHTGTHVLGDLIVYGVSKNFNGAHTPGGGITERNDIAETGLGLAVGDLTADATSETPAYSWAQSTNFGSIGIVISAGGDTAAAPIVATVDIPTPPRGNYRLLVRADGQGDVWALGAGFAYGGITETPDVSAEFPGVTGPAAGYEMIDAGVLRVPPLQTPDNATIGTFTIRLAFYLKTAAVDATLDLDSILLMPIDDGFMFVSKASGTDVILVDGISDLRAASLLNTSEVIQSYPAAQGGAPPEAHPEGTRIYFANGDTTPAADIADGWTIGIRYKPRFLSVAGT